MDLTPDPLAGRLRQMVANALTAVADDDPGQLWSALLDCEAAALAAPVPAGGYGLGLTAGVIVGTELGRRAMPDLYAGTALAVDALTAAGDPRGEAASFAGGKCPVVLAGFDRLLEPAPPAPPRARQAASGWDLTGTVLLDAAAPKFAGYCVPVTSDDGVLLVFLPPERVALLAVPGPHGLAWLCLDGVSVPGEKVIGSLGNGRPLPDPDGILSRARIRHAAYLLGLAAGAQALAVEHASQRHQFGRPVVEFQAVGFALAKSAIELRAVNLCVQRAAWLADTGAPDRLASVEALAQSAAAAVQVIRAAVQIHGAAGLTRTSAIHRYYLAARQCATSLARPARLWSEAGALRLAAGPATPPASTELPG